MYSLVELEVGQLFEGLAAVGAAVRFLLAVDLLMDPGATDNTLTSSSSSLEYPTKGH